MKRHRDEKKEIHCSRGTNGIGGRRDRGGGDAGTYSSFGKRTKNDEEGGGWEKEV
jgi:hypothetical protein